MDNNQSKKTAGIIALIIIAIIVITVIIVAIATNKDSKKDPDVTDKIEDNAESDLSDAVTDMVDSASEALDGVKDIIDGEESMMDNNKDSAESESSTDHNTDTTPPEDTTASLPSEFCLPVTGHISKGYSIDAPVFSLTMNDYRTHSGIDLQAELGTNVAAFAEGTVTNIYNDPFMGVCVEITHSGSLVSKYMNLSEELGEGIEVGAQVTCGQSIGKVGNTAAMEASDESHLHFEVFRENATIDPMEFLDVDVIADFGYEN
ncbi:MAG: M23 family metallopeptidase [Clostridia bacterium]|nr:M23 family metallopeptidase [Clostridia bacterium]